MLGLTLAFWGRAEEALIDYNKAIKINPLDAIAYNNRGVILNNIRVIILRIKCKR